MPLLPSDGRFLDQSLDLAQNAAAFASPNPTVGCVLVRDAHVLGAGAHRYDGRDHAEIAALKAAAAAGHDVRGATAYVTLEPCSHHGRTGPCADALVAAGIGRCVVATIDPNPVVAGTGIARLRAAGVSVDLLDPESLTAQRARRLNDAFAFSVQHGRPFVTMKIALSRDGKIAPRPEARSTGAPFWLTGPAARADVQVLRHDADVLLTGVGTVLGDDPLLTDRTGLPRRRPLLRAILDSSLRTPPEAALVREADNDVLLFCDEAVADSRSRQTLEKCALQIVPMRNLRQPQGLKRVLAYLHERQYRSVMTEAGAGVNAAFLQAGLTDRVVLYFADCELGPEALAFAGGGESAESLQQRLTTSSRARFQNGSTQDVRIAGYIHDPWSGV